VTSCSFVDGYKYFGEVVLLPTSIYQATQYHTIVILIANSVEISNHTSPICLRALLTLCFMAESHIQSWNTSCKESDHVLCDTSVSRLSVLNLNTHTHIYRKFREPQGPIVIKRIPDGVSMERMLQQRPVCVHLWMNACY
jgi:hypothetical protein